MKERTHFVSVSKSEYELIRKRQIVLEGKQMTTEDYENIFGKNDTRCLEIASCAHHDIPMMIQVVENFLPDR